MVDKAGWHEKDRLRSLERGQEKNTTNIGIMTTKFTAYAEGNDRWQKSQNGFLKSTAKQGKRNEKWLIFLSIGTILHLSGVDLDSIIRVLIGFIIGG